MDKEEKRLRILRLKNRYPAGTRVELDSAVTDPIRIPRGTTGTIQSVDGAGQILVRWDTLDCVSVLTGRDIFHVTPRTRRDVMKRIVQAELAELQEEWMRMPPEDLIENAGFIAACRTMAERMICEASEVQLCELLIREKPLRYVSGFLECNWMERSEDMVSECITSAVEAMYEEDRDAMAALSDEPEEMDFSM